MADPVTVGALAATALSMAAEAAMKGAVGEAAKDAYKNLRDVVACWIGNDVEALEKNPTSTGRQSVIAEEIDNRPENDKKAVNDLSVKLIEELKREGITHSNISTTVVAKYGSVAAGGNIIGNTTVTNRDSNS